MILRLEICKRAGSKLREAKDMKKMKREDEQGLTWIISQRFELSLFLSRLKDRSFSPIFSHPEALSLF